MGYVCGDCKIMDKRKINKDGEAWCYKYRTYYPVDDTRTCSDFDPEEKISACYLTTALCNILGFDDNCCILNILRGFRENYMRKDKEGIILLQEYDTHGPIIASALYKDPHKEYFAYEMLTSTIIPCLQLIQEGKNIETMEAYKRMYYSLIQDLPTYEYCKESKMLKKIRKSNNIE